MEKFIRGLVKGVFIACYVAFMAASIKHVAAFFNNFEPNQDNTIGSYALAGAFDITALVTTIGVMFFRKSMPRWVFVIVWFFIAGIASYSYVINLEYTSHYQSMTLLMQPTGQTTPVLDAHGNVQYVPVMQINTTLEWINPFLASGFTIFSLIYSVIAEFFGTKQPTAKELQERKTYLEETAPLQEAIAKLEAKNKKPGLISRAKDTAKELAKAGKEVAQTMRQSDPQTGPIQAVKGTHKPRTTDPLNPGFVEGLDAAKTPLNGEDSEDQTGGIEAGKSEMEDLLKSYPGIASWLSTGKLTASQKEVIEVTGHSPKMIANRVHDGTLKRHPRNSKLIIIRSVLTWLKTSPLPKSKEAANLPESIA